MGKERKHRGSREEGRGRVREEEDGRESDSKLCCHSLLSKSMSTDERRTR